MLLEYIEQKVITMVKELTFIGQAKEQLMDSHGIQVVIGLVEKKYKYINNKYAYQYKI